MRVAYITAGAAGMYCGSCMRDNTLVRALRRQGVDATLVPTYTPIQVDVEDASTPRIFYGGVSVYLEQLIPLWGRAPRFVRRALDARRLLAFVSRFAVNNQAKKLGALTISVLRGEDGRQSRDLDELCRWLETQRPDVVHLTNSLFAGLAPAITRRVGAPVFCTLQGEDLFLDGLTERDREEAIGLIRQHSGSIARFVAVSEYYRRFMSERIGLPLEKIDVVPPAIPREEADALRAIRAKRSRNDGDPTTIGYFARVCPEKGAGALADAFIALKTMDGCERTRLRVGGYLGPADRRFVSDVMSRLARAGVARDVEIIGTATYEEKIAFLESIDVFSVPAIYHEPKGLYVLEAFAAGLPVVQPRHGAFPELVEMSGGGSLVEPDDSGALASGLAELVRDRDRRRQLGAAAGAGFDEHSSDDTMAASTLACYRAGTG